MTAQTETLPNDNPSSSSNPLPASSSTTSPPAPHEPDYEPLATSLNPLTSATLTVRIIKSFEYRTQKSLVLRNLNFLDTTVGMLMDLCREAVKTAPGFKPYRSLQLDTLKRYTVAHGHKTTNLIINIDHDDWILDDPKKTLAELGMENETELSFFNRSDYEAFTAHPEVRW